LDNKNSKRGNWEQWTGKEKLSLPEATTTTATEAMD